MDRSGGTGGGGGVGGSEGDGSRAREHDSGPLGEEDSRATGYAEVSDAITYQPHPLPCRYLH
jgi:hypothetical protein